MPVNPIKDAIRRGGAAVGTICPFPSPEIAEILGVAGYECVLLDMEHGPLTTETVQAMIRACRVVGLTPFVRVPDHNPKQILRVLDSGALGVMVPQVETLEQAAALAAAVRYPPAGARSLAGNTAAARWGTVPAVEHVPASNEAVLLMVQIETRRGLEAAAAIARVPGVDMLFIGPNDLSLSLGHPGDWSHAEVQDAIRRIIHAAQGAGTAAGILALTPEDVTAYRAMGAALFLDGCARLVLKAMQAQAAALRGAAAAAGTPVQPRAAR